MEKESELKNLLKFFRENWQVITSVTLMVVTITNLFYVVASNSKEISQVKAQMERHVEVDEKSIMDVEVIKSKVEQIQKDVTEMKLDIKSLMRNK